MLGRWVSGGKRQWIALPKGTAVWRQRGQATGSKARIHCCASRVRLADLGRRAATAAQKLEQAIPAAEAGERVAIYAR